VEINASKLYNDMLEIASKPATASRFTWELDFLVTGVPVKTLKDIDRLYVNNFSDIIMVEVSVGMGTYSTEIYPFKDDLQATLYKKATKATGDEISKDTPIYAQTYSCTLGDKISPAMVNGGVATSDKETGDRSNIITLSIQLTNIELETIRGVEVAGIYRNVTMKDLLRTLMLNNAKIGGPPPLPVPLGEFKQLDFKGIAGVNIVDPSNEHVYDHVIIPPGVRLVDLPNFLQGRYGVYSAGIGYYLYRGLWYIYPNYDYTRFNKVAKTLTIANVPGNKMTGADKTYQVKGDQVYVLATGEMQHIDNSETDQLNLGNGYRQLRSSLVIDDFATVSKNKATVVRKDNMVETVIERRKAKKEYVYFSANKISDNVAVENSKLAGRIGGFIHIQWENSEEDLVYPGMPVKVLYLKHDTVIEVMGVIHRAETLHSLERAGYSNLKHNSTTVLTVYIKRESI